jgi:beta-1,4-mannosyltransferase
MKVLAWPAFSNREWNPYNGLLCGAMQRKGVVVLEFKGPRSRMEKADIFHVHWPDLSLKVTSWTRALVRCTWYLLIILRARLHGARVVWTAHNLQSHENLYPRLEAVFWWLFVREVDGIISLSEAGLTQVQQMRLGKRKIPTVAIAHGHYRDAYPNQVSRAEARRHLNIGPTAFVVGWIGQIRAYKGLPELVGAWRKRAAGENVLLIAGHPSDPSLRELLETSAREDSSIHFHSGRVDDDDFQHYINASDVIVMPYRKILNSGSALLGLSFDRPVALPRSDVMAELQNQVGSDWVYLYEGEFNERILQEICEWTEKTARPARAPLAALEWDLLAQTTVNFFQQVLSRKPLMENQ